MKHALIMGRLAGSRPDPRHLALPASPAQAARQLGYDRHSGAKLAMLMSIPTILASGVLLTADVGGAGDMALLRAGAIAAVFAFLAALAALRYECACCARQLHALCRLSLRSGRRAALDRLQLHTRRVRVHAHPTVSRARSTNPRIFVTSPPRNPVAPSQYRNEINYLTLRPTRGRSGEPRPVRAALQILAEAFTALYCPEGRNRHGYSAGSPPSRPDEFPAPAKPCCALGHHVVPPELPDLIARDRPPSPSRRSPFPAPRKHPCRQPRHPERHREDPAPPLDHRQHEFHQLP